MKKLLIASAIAASMATSAANAAIVVLNFDATMTAVISQGSSGSQSATGFATIVVDDVAGLGWLALDMSGSTSSASFGQTLSADVDNFITGTFNPFEFLGLGTLTVGDGVSEVTSCTNTSPAVFGNTVCSNAPVGSTTTFLPINVSAGDLSNVTFQNSLDVAAPFVGNVNTLQSYVLSVNPALGTDAVVVHPTAPSAVPVPAAAWLFGSALVGLAGIGRKRKVA